MSNRLKQNSRRQRCEKMEVKAHTWLCAACGRAIEQDSLCPECEMKISKAQVVWPGPKRPQ